MKCKHSVLASFAYLSVLVCTCFSRVRADGEMIFILPNRANQYWSTLANGIRDSAAEHGVKAVVYEGDSDSSAEEQLNLCAIALERKPSFLAMATTKISTGVQCLRRAMNAGVKVAEMDSTLPVEEALKGGVNLTFAVGSDNLTIGRRAAEYAATILADRPGDILVLEGAVGSSAGSLRPKGFRERIVELAPKARIASSVSAEWDRLKAMSITSDTMQRNPDLKLVFAANDVMALGAVEALKILGKLPQVTVIGVDGTADARRSILAEELSASVAQLPYLVGRRAVELAMDVGSGKAIAQREITDTPILTKAILSQKDSEVLKYVR